MKLTASFEDGSLSLHLVPETESEQRMIGAVIDQPQAEQGCAYMDKSLISAALSYESHWSNKRINRLTLSVYRPNKVGEAGSL